MPTRNVILTEDQDRFVGEVVEAGLYRDAAEVVDAGLRQLEQRRARDEAKLARLRALVAEAEAEYERGEYIEVAADRLGEWLAGLGKTGRGARL